MQQSICQPRYLSTGNHRPVSVLVTRVREVKHAGETLSPSARLLLRSIVDYCGNESCCWPSSRRLAAECGLSIRQVRRLLRELEASGWIATGARHRDDGGQTSNVIRWMRDPSPSSSPAGHPPRTSMSPRENSGNTQTHKKHNASCGSDENRTPAAQSPETLQQPPETPAAVVPVVPLPEPQRASSEPPAAPAWQPDQHDGGPVAMSAILKSLPSTTTAARPEPQRARQVPSSAAPAAQPGSRYLVIRSDRLPDPEHVRAVYSAAVAAGLLRDSESTRLRYLSCVCELLRRYRAGKCRNPGGSLRWLLDRPGVMLEYPTAASESRARTLLSRVFANWHVSGR